MNTRGEAVAVGKRLLRGFAGAPDPRRHAQTLYAELARAEGWSENELDLINGLGAWLKARPSVAELKPRCEHVMAALR